MSRVSHLLTDDHAGFSGGVERHTVRDVIADKIVTLIACGLLNVGDELPGERELAAALTVSRQTIRSAVQMLAAQGILSISHGARTRVASADLSARSVAIASRLNVNRYDVHAVHAARSLIELQVVGDAAVRMTEETLDALQRSMAAQAVSLHDPVQFLICDREFHVTIYRQCGNPLLADIVTDLYTYMIDHRRRAVSEPDAIAESFADHRSIMQALEMRDAAATMAAFALHEERIYASTQRVMTGRAELWGEPGGTARPFTS